MQEVEYSRSDDDSHASSSKNNYKQRNDLLAYFKPLALNSLPHLAILILFLIYSLIGAAIFKEIETKNLITSSKVQTGNQLSSIKYRNDLKNDESFLRIKSQQIKLMLKEHKSKVNSNLNNFLDKYNHVNIENSTQKTDEIISETLELLGKLNLKNTNLKKTAGNHLAEFVVKSKGAFQQDVKSIIDKYNNEQKLFEKRLYELLNRNEASLVPEHVSNDEHETCMDDECQLKRIENKKFLQSFHFIMASLTTIGYGGVIPQTIIGKLFTMTYLAIGIPLTLILLSELGKLMTRHLNFLYNFYTILCIDIYYDQIVKFCEKKRMRLTTTLFKLAFSRTKRPKTQNHNQKHHHDNLSNKSILKSMDFNHISVADTTNDSIIQLLNEIFNKCLENSNVTFNFSFGFLFFIVFIYLTIGALLNARMTNMSIFDGYYFTLLILTRIESGDILIETNMQMIASFIYVLIGMSFFSLTINFLQEKIRQILLRNGNTIISEMSKFVNQFGYELKSEDFNLTLSIPKEPLENNFANKPKVVEKVTKRRKSDVSLVHKCDKQTQITTLLYSRVKYDKKFDAVGENDETPNLKKPEKVRQNKFSFESARSNFSSTPSKFKSIARE